MNRGNGKPSPLLPESTGDNCSSHQCPRKTDPAALHTIQIFHLSGNREDIRFFEEGLVVDMVRAFAGKCRPDSAVDPVAGTMRR
jgi:hypothetical protein